MNKLLTFSFIGGDLRQLRVISSLAKNGFHIKVYGILREYLGNNVYISESASACAAGADAVVLPLPYSADMSVPFDKREVNAPLFNNPIFLRDVLEGVSKGTIVFAGRADDDFINICNEAEISMYDYATREDMAIMNAIPTAEGAIEVAMANTATTIHGSRCLVIGYGKIGKILSADLRALGAEVTASARSYRDLALIRANNCRCAKTSEIGNIIGEFDIIFNTVPHMILDFSVLSKTRQNVLIIDLASKPGGVDFKVAQELGRNTIWALSLPGKVAPDTAGMIVKDTLINILEELGV